MISIETEEIPKGSYIFRIFIGSVPNESDIDTVGYFFRVNEDTVEVAGVHGDLSNDVNIVLGLKAIELGFRHMRFHALRGKKVTRYAKYCRSDDVYDYYTIDLLETAQSLGL